jgi:hypothetical protein
LFLPGDTLQFISNVHFLEEFAKVVVDLLVVNTGFVAVDLPDVVVREEGASQVPHVADLGTETVHADIEVVRGQGLQQVLGLVGVRLFVSHVLPHSFQELQVFLFSVVAQQADGVAIPVLSIFFVIIGDFRLQVPVYFKRVFLYFGFLLLPQFLFFEVVEV